MKPSERKQKLVEELANLYEELDVRRLYSFPSQKDTQKWLADVASVLKNLDESDYQEFVRLSKTVGLSESREERKKAAQEINQFLGRKVAEWKRYDSSALDMDKSIPTSGSIGVLIDGAKDSVIDSSIFSDLDVGILDKGERTKVSRVEFRGKQLSSQNVPSLKFGEAGKNGHPGGGGSVFIQAETFNFTGAGKITADDGGGVINTTYGSYSPITINIKKISNLIDSLELEFEENYKDPDKEEIRMLFKDLKSEALQGNEQKFKQILGALLTRGAEIAQVTSLIVQILALSSGSK